MSIAIRPMKSSEADAVSAFVHGLARDLSLDVVPNLTGDKLREAADLVSVMVAENDGALCGACLSLMTYSTFRAAKGLYIVDLFVSAELRGQNIGFKLLYAAASAGAKRGAQFIKLEVDTSNKMGARFYERLGFARKDGDRLFVLEHGKFNQFINEG